MVIQAVFYRWFFGTVHWVQTRNPTSLWSRERSWWNPRLCGQIFLGSSQTQNGNTILLLMVQKSGKLTSWYGSIFHFTWLYTSQVVVGDFFHEQYQISYQYSQDFSKAVWIFVLLRESNICSSCYLLPFPGSMLGATPDLWTQPSFVGGKWDRFFPTKSWEVHLFCCNFSIGCFLTRI